MSSNPQNAAAYHRYCPGEERIRISDAVCLGRRRSNYPKCKGCQFNDDEREAAKSAPEDEAVRPVEAASTVAAGRGALVTARPAMPLAPRVDLIESLFTAYDIRGRYPDPLDAEAAWRIGQACAQFLRSELRGYDRSRTDKSAVVVGRDMRKSSRPLAEALMDGLRAGGAPVIDLGLIDTPQLCFAVNRLTCCGGVQVTGGHHEPAYNGFKICGQKARPVSANTGLTKVSKIAKNTLRHTTAQVAELQQADLTESYRGFVRSFLREDDVPFTPEEPLRVVVDASNGMAGRAFALVFGDLDWLDVVRLNFEHNGEFIHGPDPVVEENLSQVRDRVIRAKAAFGVCFDGDADRCVFVDHEGQPVSGDLVTALFAGHFLREFPGATIVYDVRCSRVVAQEVRKVAGVPRRERCGSPFIKKALLDTKGAFGGELTGHFYFRDNWCSDSGLIAFAAMVNILGQSGRLLKDLIAPLRRYAKSAELSFCCDDPQRTMEQLADTYHDAEIDYLDGITVQYADWWFNLRPGNTAAVLRLNVEAADATMLATKLSEICPRLGSPVSPGEQS